MDWFFLFGGEHLWLGALLSIGSFFLVNAVDNATGRIRIEDLVKKIYMTSFVLAILSLGFSYV